jgi:uncharacterized protein YbcC (UPF0753/DUF2309 family)
MPSEIYVRKRTKDSDRYKRFKAKLDADPVFKAQYLEKQRLRNAESRRRAKEGETPEEKARRTQRAREAISKAVRKANARRRLERLANAKEKGKSGEKVDKPTDKTTIGNGKRKPGRLLALLGWRGF